jgi:hypothetical protein
MNGMIEHDTAPRLHFDANIFIYAIKGEPRIFNPLQELFSLLKAKRGIAVTSELTLAEVMAGASDVARRNYINLIVWSRIFDLRPVSRRFCWRPRTTAKRLGCRSCRMRSMWSPQYAPVVVRFCRATGGFDCRKAML